MEIYPEHEKVHAIADKSQLIGEFLEWLTGERDITLAYWKESTNIWNEASLQPIWETREQLLAEFFGVDLKRLADEKDRLYEEVIQMNKEKENAST